MNENAVVEKVYHSIKRNGLIESLGAVLTAGAQVEMGFNQRCCDTEVGELDLSVRSYNALMRGGYKTVGQVITAINDGNLSKIRNLGVKSIAEIRMFILCFGYHSLSERRKKEFIYHLIFQKENFYEN